LLVGTACLKPDAVANGALAAPFHLESFLRHLTAHPGVYRMISAEGSVIYVGKAKNLKRRVTSYFRGNDHSPKTRSMVAQIASIEVTVTHTEHEALILENILIKAHQPRYNILLRDDKSYPLILLTQEAFPRLAFHRGKRLQAGRYFGPYPSGAAVRDSLNLLQKLFQVRQCDDNTFRTRSRPCLQYQIKRCGAPCVGYIDREVYGEEVKLATLFLEGRSSAVIDELVMRMEIAASRLEFETAARLRDQIISLRRLQERQYIAGERESDLDIIAVAKGHGVAAVQIFYIRGGRNLGNKPFFPRLGGEEESGEIVAAFIAQFYLAERGDERPIPAEILVSDAIADSEVLVEALSRQAGHRVVIHHRVRGDRARWLELARTNASQALTMHQLQRASLDSRFDALQRVLALPEPIERIECFDISHTQGEATVASCVVFNREGAFKSEWRRYNISDITAGDDYAAMRQALERRFRKVAEGEGRCPDLLLIDGGRGQLQQAIEVLSEAGIFEVTLMGVAKGVTRKPGMEQLFLPGCEQPLILPGESPALHLIQQIRDEAHRFAITGHRQRRSRSRNISPLEGINGLGQKRRQLLLRHLGGMQEVLRASVDDLQRVAGISRLLAERIHATLHPDEG
jgi:excinuclease ABC subunit C